MDADFPLIFVHLTSALAAGGIIGLERRYHGRPAGFMTHAHHFVRFDRDSVVPEKALKEFLASHGFTVANMSHRLSDDGSSFEYRMVIRTNNPDNLSELAMVLRELRTVRAFRISPTGD